MARTLSRTLSLTQSSPGIIQRFTATISQQHLSFCSPTVGVSDRRYRSTRGQYIEVDLDSSSSDGDVEVLGLKKQIEDVIHSFNVRRHAPDWLPFRPGSSYWIPPPKPRRTDHILELFGKLAHPLTEEEILASTSVRGWPKSSFFIEEGASSPDTNKIKKVASPDVAPVKVELHILSDSELEKWSESEEEE